MTGATSTTTPPRGARRRARRRVTLLDTADVYGDGRSEERIRKALAPRSDRPFVATKAGRRADPFEAAQYTPENLRAWIDRSRRNLGVDTLDLVQLHCPPPAVYSDQRVYDTLDALVAEEAIAAYGVSVETVAEGLTALHQPGVQSIQVILNIFRRKPLEELLPAAAGGRRRHPGPGAAGQRPAHRQVRRVDDFPADDHRNFNRHGEAFDVGETFSGVPFDVGVAAAREVAEIAGDAVPTAAFALRWVIDQPGVTTVIPGARNVTQVRGNVAAASHARPSPTPSSPTSSGCTTSASAPTCTTAGNRPPTRRSSERLSLVLRTHDAGTLRASDAGSTVTLAGWVARRRDHGGVVFLDLRDASGYVQVVVREEEAHHLRNEYCVLVTGEVRRRPEGNENPELPTGEIEVADLRRCEVLSARRSAAVPDRDRPGGVRRRPLQVPLPRPASRRARRGAPAALARSTGSPAVSWPARLRRGGDADADPLHARRARATSSSPSGCSRASGTPCRSRRSCSSSC